MPYDFLERYNKYASLDFILHTLWKEERFLRKIGAKGGAYEA